MQTLKMGYYIEKGCNGGDNRGCVRLGQLLLKGKYVDADPNRALSIFEKSCAGGQGFGCYALARAYRKGDGVVKDDTKAKSLFEQGCENEHGPSCGILAIPLMEAKSQVSHSDFKKGCKFQDGVSCRALGDFYLDGKEVEQSVDKAYSSYDNGCGTKMQSPASEQANDCGWAD